ncbi:hypothetical protein [Novilysobacter spongiicola]|uniref:Lysophospholipase L1 n=1 Tax=Lysobacter spongiicola DSM 21749 TaxID=1122188 RepID=A0A1T4SD38_9GAMM|nr:hypothetical protein [Lysobacter spongiicola]SKA26067.1 hypothetical protein SAMN02745674_02752 [Lysobacter spongiicola DSM 21749]
MIRKAKTPGAAKGLARTLIILVLIFLLGCASGADRGALDGKERLLFVGNSLTYVGNLPAVFEALAEANGRTVSSDMIVRGGATLSERVSDRSVERALDERRYTALILQERGGDLTCSFGSESCARSRRAIADLAALATSRGVQVFLLGSYQAHPDASRERVREESAAAAAAGLPYLDVSSRLQKLLLEAPQLAWFAPDGMHPGQDLALLNAVVTYRALFGTLPAKKDLTVVAPIYGSRSGLTEALRAADARPPLPDTPGKVSYSAQTLGKLIGTLVGKPAGDRS